MTMSVLITVITLVITVLIVLSTDSCSHQCRGGQALRSQDVLQQVEEADGDLLHHSWTALILLHRPDTGEHTRGDRRGEEERRVGGERRENMTGGANGT